MTLAALARPITIRSTDATWTAEDWNRLPDDGSRYEIIDGVLHMSTAPSLFRQWISGEMYQVLRRQLFDTGIAFVFSAPTGVFMPGCDPVQPDLIVVRQEDRAISHDKRVFGIPALLVEILSPSNAEIVTETKRSAYAHAGVPDYWVMRPGERDVLVHSDPDTATGSYRTVTSIPSSNLLTSPTLPVRATVADFFAGAPDTTL